MDFSIHMGIPEMLELWMRLHKESMDGSISKADANLYKKWPRAERYYHHRIGTHPEDKKNGAYDKVTLSKLEPLE